MTNTRFLVDTHILLWALIDDPRLPHRHRQILIAGEGLIVSVVSIWEIAIKRPLGKLKRSAQEEFPSWGSTST